MWAQARRSGLLLLTAHPDAVPFMAIIFSSNPLWSLSCVLSHKTMFPYQQLFNITLCGYAPRRHLNSLILAPHVWNCNTPLLHWHSFQQEDFQLNQDRSLQRSSHPPSLQLTDPLPIDLCSWGIQLFTSFQADKDWEVVLPSSPIRKAFMSSLRRSSRAVLLFLFLLSMLAPHSSRSWSNTEKKQGKYWDKMISCSSPCCVYGCTKFPLLAFRTMVVWKYRNIFPQGMWWALWLLHAYFRSEIVKSSHNDTENFAVFYLIISKRVWLPPYTSPLMWVSPFC